MATHVYRTLIMIRDADRVDAISIFHRRFDPHVLPQDTSKHESSSDTQRYRASSCSASRHIQAWEFPWYTTLPCFFMFCLKTHPSMRVPVIHNATVLLHRSPSHSVPGPLPAPPSHPVNRTSNNARSLTWILAKRKTQPHEAFFMIECVCNAWFTFELAIRSVSSAAWGILSSGNTMSYKQLVDISPNLHFGTVVDKDEMVKFWGQKVIGQGHNETTVL